MRYKVVLYPYQEALKEVSKELILSGSKCLENSRKIEKYGVSLRELFGLGILCYLRNELEPAQWFFSTNKQLSDDGAVVRVNKDNSHSEYQENIEQIYLPGKFLGRESHESINDYILRQIKEIKGKKGSDYRRDKSLLVFGDIYSKNNQDCFEWQDFVKKFFNEETFLHLYFISLLKHTETHNDYYMLSFTNQKHRQILNGEFNFKLGFNGIFDFKCLQKINLLNHEKEGILKVPKKREDKIL